MVVMGYVFVFLYTLYFQYASFRKRTELISLSTFIAGFLNIFLNYWLIPIFGYKVAAATTLVSFIALFLLHFANAKFILRERVIPLMKVLPGLFYLLGIMALYMLWVAQLPYLLSLPVKVAVIGISFYVLIYKPSRRATA